MASIYKRKELRPIPQGATIVTFRGKPHAAWTNGKTGKSQRAPLNESGGKIIQEAACYTVEYFDERGLRKKVSSGCADKDAAQQIANDLEKKAALRKQGLLDPTAERYAMEGRRPILEHVAEYIDALRAREVTAKYIRDTDSYIRRVIDTAQASCISDLAPSVVAKVLAGHRAEGRGLVTVNAYLRAVKSFTRWAWRDKRTVDDALASLSGFNTALEDKRHARREATQEELAYLLAFVERYTLPWHTIPGPDRSLLYRVALGTGFRAGELRSLTPASFDLDSDPPTVTVEASYSKRRRRDVQPIQHALADRLKLWLESKPEGERVFPGMTVNMARTLRLDLEAARAQWIAAAANEAERKAREESQFLRYEDEDGRFCDFHAFRFAYISNVVATGASVKTAQTLARHSNPALTIGRYAQARLHDLQGAVESMAGDVPSEVKQSRQATGTDDRTPDGTWSQKWEQSSGSSCSSVAPADTRHDDSTPSMVDDSDVSQTIAFPGKQAVSALRATRLAPSDTVEKASLSSQSALASKSFPSDELSANDHLKSRGKRHGSSPVGANLGAVETNSVQTDPGLMAVVERWPQLTKRVRAAILKLAQGK